VPLLRKMPSSWSHLLRPVPAFVVNAIDYLLKPVDSSRLPQALNRHERQANVRITMMRRLNRTSFWDRLYWRTRDASRCTCPSYLVAI